MNMNQIKTWEDWCETFQDIETFRPLITEIYSMHNLSLIEIENTYPGTNAVFQVGSTIVKIFVPSEIVSWENEYFVELKRMRLLEGKNVKISKMLCHGCIEKELKWYYIVYERIEGVHFDEVRSHLTIHEKRQVVSDVKSYLTILHSLPTEKKTINYDKRVIESERYSFLSEEIRDELSHYVSQFPKDRIVSIHGDITADNVLYNKEEGIYVIDYGDSQEGYFYYEYAPIVLDLFGGDKELIDMFFEGILKEERIELVLKSILIHDFGGNIITHYLGEIVATSLNNLLNQIRRYLKAVL